MSPFIDLGKLEERVRIGVPNPWPGLPELDINLPDLPFPVPTPPVIERNARWIGEIIAGLVGAAISPTVMAIIAGYIAYLESQSGTKQRLSSDVQNCLRSHFPAQGSFSLEDVRYAEGINTIHGQAITIGNNIYFTSSLNLRLPADIELLCHELEHCTQYAAQGGIVAFLAKYGIEAAAQIIQRRSINVHDFIGLEEDAANKAARVCDDVGTCFAGKDLVSRREVPLLGTVDPNVEGAAPGQSSIGGCLASDGTYLYWWDNRVGYMSLHRAAIQPDGKLGGSERVEKPPSSIDPTHGIAIGGGFLYYWDTRAEHGSLRRAPINSDGTLGDTEKVEEDHSTSVDPARGLAIDDGYLYFWDTRREHRRVLRSRIRADGTLTPTEVVETPPSSVGGLLTASAGYLYWWDSRPECQSLRRARIRADGTITCSEMVEEPTSSLDITKGLAITGDNFYWFDTRHQQLSRGQIR